MDEREDGKIRSEDLGYGDDDPAGPSNKALSVDPVGNTADGMTSGAPPTRTGMETTGAEVRPHEELPKGAQTPSTRTTNNTGSGPQGE